MKNTRWRSLVAASWLAAMAPTMAAQIPSEHQISNPLIDCDLTPNSRFGVARGMYVPNSSDAISVWDMATGTKLAIQNPGLGFGRGAWSFPSDMIALTNTRAFVIGSRDAYPPFGPLLHESTQVDVIDLRVSPPQCIESHFLNLSITQGVSAGEANDIAITPNGDLAVLSHRNWIHVFDTATGDIKAQINTFMAIGTNSPDECVDSVEVTNDRAIVIVDRQHQSNPVRVSTWAFVVDLTLTPPALTPGSPVLVGTLDGLFEAHDVKITPDGTLAVVTSDHAVGLIDMITGGFPTANPADSYAVFSDHFRTYREQVDSVEVTNDRAVVIGNRMNLTQGTENWVVQVFELDPNSVPALRLLQQYDDPVVPPPHINRPHDLEINSDGTKAVIKTSRENLVITDLQNPTPTTLWVSPSNGDPYSGFLPSGDVFVSDSVVIGEAFVEDVLYGSGDSGLRQYAITIGSDYAANRRGWIDVIDIAFNPPQVRASFPLSSPPMVDRDVFPADLQLAKDGLGVFVRSTAGPNDPVLGNTTDLTYARFSPLGIVSSWGGSGTMFGVDSLEVGRNRAFSIGDDSFPPAGHVHMVGF